MPASGQLDFHVHAGSQIQLHQRVDRLRRRLHNVKHTLVRADFELLARLLVDMRATVDRELFDARRMRAPVRRAVSAMSPVA